MCANAAAEREYLLGIRKSLLVSEEKDFLKILIKMPRLQYIAKAEDVNKFIRRIIWKQSMDSQERIVLKKMLMEILG